MNQTNSGELSKALKFQVTEAYKKARTNIVYSLAKKGCKKIIFTSAEKGEGKTTTVLNIAVGLTQMVNTKVLVIDCDLRRPSVHTAMNLEPAMGLVNYINDECGIDELITKSDNENLDFITFGAIPPNPSELLSSSAMAELFEEMEKRYDYILCDTPPINLVVDLVPLIGLTDGIVLIAKNGDTTYPEFIKAVDTLKMNNGKVLGVIVNKVPSGEKNKKIKTEKSVKEHKTYYA